MIRRDPSGGQVRFRWQVSYNEEHGPARQGAYRTEKLIVNRCLDEAPRPLSRYVRLGSLRSIAQRLSLGADTNKAKLYLLQNASTFITAKLSYTSKDGRAMEIEEAFTRYNLRFWREKFDDGTEADAVYIRLNDPFYRVVNESPTRPLDYDYLYQLPPSASRLYELLSFQIFAAVKHQRPEGKLRYSEYCMLAPQTRYTDARHMQIQMAVVHRPHRASGYIADVRYEKTTDEEGKPDWFIFYTPGRKARNEFAAFHDKHRTRSTKPALDASRETVVPPHKTPKILGASGGASQEVAVNKELLAALVGAGVTATTARQALVNGSLEQQQHVRDCLAYWEGERAQGKDVGAGLLVALIQGKIQLPETFETGAQQHARQQAEAQAQGLRVLKQQLERKYEAYCAAEIQRYIADKLPSDEYQKLLAIHKKKLTDQYSFWRDEQRANELERMTQLAVRQEVGARLILPTFEEFARQQETALDRSGDPERV